MHLPFLRLVRFVIDCFALLLLFVKYEMPFSYSGGILRRKTRFSLFTAMNPPKRPLQEVRYAINCD